MAPKAAVKKVAAKAAKAASPKGHGKGPDAVPAGGGAAAGIGGTAISVEQQGRNAAHYAQVAEWRDTIYGHDLFSDIGRALPLSIADSGTQHPFDAGDFAIAIARDAGSYTAGINLFWCEPLYSPAPSIPIRTMSAQGSDFNTNYLRYWRYTPEGEWRIAIEVLNPY